MKDSRLHIVGLESLDDQCVQLATGDPNNPDYANKAWFFMYCYKVLLCPKRYSHDWGACPYAHHNEGARRRDPQRYNYSSCICPNTGKGECPHGVQCRYAHTLFEYWLHPSRFRTQRCKQGADCKRALCFFAHSDLELRQPNKSNQWCHGPPQPSSAAVAGSSASSFGDLSAVAAATAAAGASEAAMMPLALGLSRATSQHTGLDSSSSNVSTSTCQQAGSPTCLGGIVGDLATADTRGISSLPVVGTLQPPSFAIAASAASLGVQQPTPMTLMPLGAQHQHQHQHQQQVLPCSAALTASVVTSMPQLVNLLQHQQQQQLAAGLSSMTLQPAVNVAPQAASPYVATLIGQQPVMQVLMQQHPVQHQLGLAAGNAVLQGISSCTPGMASLAPVQHQHGTMQQMGVGNVQYIPWM